MFWIAPRHQTGHDQPIHLLYKFWYNQFDHANNRRFNRH